nr:MFS transporter [uncultured Actinotalea sp.]
MGHPFAAYGELPRLAGRSFLPVAFAARLPFSMTGLGILLLVTTTTGSVGQGGLATGAASVGTALLGPVQGRLADRYGQRPVVLVAVALDVLALLAVVAATASGAPTAALLAACFVAGGAAPQVGAFTRARWVALTRARPAPLRAAMGYESTADEVTFVLGPALVGVIGATGRPEATLLLAAALVAGFGTWFALHPTATAGTRSRARSAEAPRTSAAGLARLLAAPLVGMLGVGVFFGGTQAALTAFATDLGRPGAAGLLYAVMGVGSAVTALAVVALPQGVGLRTRWVVGGAGMAVSLAGVLGVTSLGGAVAVIAVTGLFVGPTLVTLFTVGGDAAPAGEAGATLTLLVSGNVVGVAIGATAAGALADASAAGDPTPFLVPVLAAVAVAVAGAVPGTAGGRRTGPPRRA